MTTQDDATRSTAMTIDARSFSRTEKLQALRDDLAPGERPAPIVPRTFAEVYTMCEALAKADLAPKHLRGKAMDMTLVVMTGLEVGLPPMASLRLYTTWDGVPRLMAEGVRALVLQSPAIEYFEVATCDDTHATWVGKRRGRPEKSVTWTVERAKKAGLLGKENWSKYQQDMLNARASMQLSRLIAPDVVAGMVSREEANDGDFIEASLVEQPKFTAPPSGVPFDASRVVAIDGGPIEKGKLVATPPTAPAASASGGRSTTSRRNSAPTGSSEGSSTTSKLDAAVKAVEDKRADPTPAASTSSTSPAASSFPSPSAQASNFSVSASSVTDQTPTTSSSTADHVHAARIADEMTRDRWGQPIGGPASGDSGFESVIPRGTETPSAASTPPAGSEADEHGYTRARRLPEAETPAPAGQWFASDFGADPSAAPMTDTAVAKIVEFEQWLATCANQREMAAGFPKWRDWAREMSDKHKDERFRTTGELAIRMKDSWGRRKAQVPA